MSDSNTPQKKEIIDAVELIDIQQGNHSTTKNTLDSSSTNTWVWLVLTVLVLLAVSVIFLLPKAVNKDITSHVSSQQNLPPPEGIQQNESDSTPIVIEQSAQQQLDTIHQTEQDQAKSEVEALLSKLINLETKLQSHAVNKWAAEEFAQAAEQGRIGDEHFRRKQYLQAAIPFNNAIARLEELEQAIQPTLEQALTRGEKALTQGDQITATQQFELAKAIEVNNVRANNGLQRASTIKELFVILQRASSFESHGQLQQAKSTYQKAIALDPLSQQAKSAFARVENKLNDQAYEQIIETGYRALQNGQYSDARAAFNSAKILKPNAKQAVLGLNKVAEAIKQEKIDNLLFEASHFAQLQQWQQASTSYEKVLQLDSQHSLARQEQQNSFAKAKALKDLTIALESADFLYKDEVLEQAEELLLRIEDMQSPGSVIDDQYEKLAQLVRVATTPVSITLQSDSNTQVTVFKVARLGAFSQHHLLLRPGPYTIVGVRNGYRDVRITIEVGPEDNNSVISVVCKEAI